MLHKLREWLAWFRAWRAANERAHRDARSGPCCSDPRSIYAARQRADKRND